MDICRAYGRQCERKHVDKFEKEVNKCVCFSFKKTVPRY